MNEVIRRFFVEALPHALPHAMMFWSSLVLWRWSLAGFPIVANIEAVKTQSVVAVAYWIVTAIYYSITANSNYTYISKAMMFISIAALAFSFLRVLYRRAVHS